LAREIGVSDTAIRHHFESREVLLASLASRGFRELLSRRLRAANSNALPREMAQEMMLLYVDFARQNTDMFNLMVGPRVLDRGAYLDLQETSEQSFSIFRNALNRYALSCGWPADQLNYVEHSAWAMEHGLAALIIGDRVPRSGETLDVDRMVEFSVRLLLDGVAARR
jgi:AcrR family transcriptional regulator